MTDLEWTAQIIGIVGTVVTLVCYHWNKRKNILKNKLLLDVVWGSHYFLLGAYAGFWANVICVFREIIFMNNDKKIFRSKAWLILFVLCNWIVAFVTWNGLFSLLPALCSTLATFSFWQQKVRITRLTALTNNLIMLAYDLCVHSYSGLLNESLGFLSTLSAYWIHRKEKEDLA